MISSKSEYFRNCFFSVFFVLVFSGLVSYENYNILPVRPILEIFFFLSSLFFIRLICIRIFVCQFVLMTYVVASLILMSFDGNDSYIDFLLIFKSIVYLFFLGFFYNYKLFSKQDLSFFLWFLLISFSIKYIVWLILGISSRPGVFGENNFELIFVLLVFIAYSNLSGGMRIKETIALIIVFSLSGSRSGIVSLLYVLVLLSLNKIDLKFFISLLIIAVVSFFAFDIFLSRMGERGIEGIDRFVFFINFLNDIESWELGNYIFGTYPITPMSEQTCHNLSFYKNLFSFEDSYTCYSVILHSFVLRTIYDHGFSTIIFIGAFIYYFIGVSMVGKRYKLAVLGVVFLSGLSVSSLNNIYVCLGLLICSTVYEREDEKEN